MTAKEQTEREARAYDLADEAYQLVQQASKTLRVAIDMAPGCANQFPGCMQALRHLEADIGAGLDALADEAAGAPWGDAEHLWDDQMEREVDRARKGEVDSQN